MGTCSALILGSLFAAWSLLLFVAALYWLS